MEDVVYMGMKNDLSFIIGDEMSLYEHQSSHGKVLEVWLGHRRNILGMLLWRKVMKTEGINMENKKNLFAGSKTEKNLWEAFAGES